MRQRTVRVGDRLTVFDHQARGVGPRGRGRYLLPEHRDLLARNLNLYRVLAHSPRAARSINTLARFIRDGSRLVPLLVAGDTTTGGETVSAHGTRAVMIGEGITGRVAELKNSAGAAAKQG